MSFIARSQSLCVNRSIPLYDGSPLKTLESATLRSIGRLQFLSAEDVALFDVHLGPIFCKHRGSISEAANPFAFD